MLTKGAVAAFFASVPLLLVFADAATAAVVTPASAAGAAEASAVAVFAPAPPLVLAYVAERLYLPVSRRGQGPQASWLQKDVALQLWPVPMHCQRLGLHHALCAYVAFLVAPPGACSSSILGLPTAAASRPSVWSDILLFGVSSTWRLSVQLVWCFHFLAWCPYPSLCSVSLDPTVALL